MVLDFSWMSGEAEIFIVFWIMIDELTCQIILIVTQLLIPTHAHFHWLKFIKNILKNSYMFRSTTVIRELQCPCQSHYYLNHSCMYAKRGGVAAYL